MKSRLTTYAAAAFVAISFTLPLQAQQPGDSQGWLGTETVKTRFGDFEFKNGYPTAAAADALLDQLKFNRAIDVYLMQIPAIGSPQSIVALQISAPSVPTRSSSGNR